MHFWLLKTYKRILRYFITYKTRGTSCTIRRFSSKGVCEYFGPILRNTDRTKSLLKYKDFLSFLFFPFLSCSLFTFVPSGVSGQFVPDFYTDVSHR